MLPRGKKPYTSKLKNPDRHIEKLKDEIERLKEVNKDHWRRHGVHEFHYIDGITTNVSPTEPCAYPELLPGTEVIFTGKVIEVRRTETKGFIEFELMQCKRIKPRGE